MTTLIEKLKSLLERRKETGQDEGQTAPDNTPNHDRQMIDAEILKNLMLMLDHTHEDMYSCEETFALLDEYVELIMKNNEEAATVMPYVKRHLEKCPGCYEAFAALRHILESEATA
ncbi:MAG: hypothetical protein M5U34_16040 [Chloroflexi bacterium]|nr:hypothetical protein [Chloroflexota bacterium]